MKLSIHSSAEPANAAAATQLAEWLQDARTLMVASGNTPIELYRLIGERNRSLGHLHVFALDEYVGVPPNEPRNCASQLRQIVAEPWAIPASQFHTVSPDPKGARENIEEHERRIAAAGGLDVIVLGLGQNGHLGFNEPGSSPDSAGRVVDLEPISVEANRKWFGGDYAPTQGVTVGLKTILAARRVLILAYGAHKTAAVHAMVEGLVGSACPASFLQRHADAHLFVDHAAAAGLSLRA